MPPGGGKGTAATRIKKEIAALAKEDTGDIKLVPNESNIFSWKCTIPGPAQSPYEGGLFDVDVRIPDDYPFSPPHLQFLTKVYHCNIASTGAICLDIIKNNWSPALSLYKVILSLSSLLTDPNPADPLVPAIAQEYKRNRKQHDATAREWVKLYALPKKTETKLAPPPPPARTTSSNSASRRTIHRPTASNSPAPTAQLNAGTRRRNPFAEEDGNDGGSSSRVIMVDDSDSDSDMEVIEGAAKVNAVNGTDEMDGQERKAKRTKTNAGGRAGGAAAGGADDVIVIDD